MDMTLESRIGAGGRRLCSSPLWLGLLIMAVLVAPTFLVPGIPLWVGLVSLLTLAPMVLLGTYATFYIYRRIRGAIGAGSPTADTADVPKARETALDRLWERYAAGEIGEETFERTVERLLETEPDARRNDGCREPDLLRE